jgi:U3 small nucleolar RNA-associated protein 11
VEEFDAAQHFHTVPELLGRTYSRPKLQTLKSKAFVKIMDEQAIERAEREKAAGYEELGQRIEREKRLSRLMEEQELQKQLLVRLYVVTIHGWPTLIASHFSKINRITSQLVKLTIV